jgi:hypothetical protein
MRLETSRSWSERRTHHKRHYALSRRTSVTSWSILGRPSRCAVGGAAAGPRPRTYDVAEGRRSAGRDELTDQPVLFVVESGAEPEGTHATGGGRAGQQRPQTVDRDRAVARVAQLADDVVAAERRDPAVAEVADQQRAGEPAEAGRCDGQAGPTAATSNSCSLRAWPSTGWPTWTGRCWARSSRRSPRYPAPQGNAVRLRPREPGRRPTRVVQRSGQQTPLHAGDERRDGQVRGCASFGLAVEALAGGAGGAGSAGHSKGWWRVCRRRVRRGLTGTHATRTGLDLSCGSPIRGAHSMNASSPSPSADNFVE